VITVFRYYETKCSVVKRIDQVNRGE